MSDVNKAANEFVDSLSQEFEMFEKLIMHQAFQAGAAWQRERLTTLADANGCVHVLEPVKRCKACGAYGPLKAFDGTGVKSEEN